MKCNLLLKKNNYALVELDNEYAVVYDYDETQRIGQRWSRAVGYFTHNGNKVKQIECLSKAIECFLCKTNPNYIPRTRLEELATLFKDGLIEDDSESAMEYFDEVCEMEDYEKEFFGLRKGKRNNIMIKFYNECIDSADWIEEITGYRPVDNVITLEELGEIAKNPQLNGGLDNGLPNHWDYPLSEIPNLMNEDYDGSEFALVRFKDINGGYEYRVCEI